MSCSFLYSHCQAFHVTWRRLCAPLCWAASLCITAARRNASWDDRTRSEWVCVSAVAITVNWSLSIAGFIKGSRDDARSVWDEGRRCGSEDVHRVDDFHLFVLCKNSVIAVDECHCISLLQWLSRPPRREGIAAGSHAEEAAGWPAKGALTFMNVFLCNVFSELNGSVSR